MTYVVELETPILHPVTGALIRTIKTRVMLPGLYELQAKLHRGDLFRDDLMGEVIDPDTGEVVDLIDIHGAFDLGPGWRDLPWRCDLKQEPECDEDGDE